LEFFDLTLTEDLEFFADSKHYGVLTQYPIGDVRDWFDEKEKAKVKDLMIKNDKTTPSPIKCFRISLKIYKPGSNKSIIFLLFLAS